jgi:hypothetical protein
LLLIIHVQVPILAPVRQIDATPFRRLAIEDEDDDEGRGRFGKRRRR